MSTPTNVRFPDAVDQALRDFVEIDGRAKSAIVVQALSEWLRLQGHPHVRFVSTSTGERRAALSGGPEVWTVVESWLAHHPDERTVDAVADATGLSPILVNAALAYWADNQSEIDDLIRRVHAAQDQAYAAWARRLALLGA